MYYYDIKSKRFETKLDESNKLIEKYKKIA